MIGKGIRVEGLEEVLGTLKNQVRLIPFRTLTGMIAGGLTIQRRAQNLVPRDLGNLRASAFTTWSKGAKNTAPSFSNDHGDASKLNKEHTQAVAESKASLSTNEILHPEVEVGFSAFYALFVHEDMEAKHLNGKQAKFLQQAVSQGMPDVIKAIETETIIKESD